MVNADKSMKDFNWRLQMFSGDSQDTVEHFQEDYKLLKERQRECREIYFIMEEQVNQFKTMGAIGSAYTNTDDDFVRDKHIDNIDKLRQSDGQLADVMQLGHEAVENSRQVTRDLLPQR